MEDLFPVGRVVPPSDLVGREAAIVDLMQRLQSGSSVIIAGPRRIGKTSVVVETLRRLKNEGLLVGRVDLLRVANRAELAESIAEACFDNLSGTAKAFRSLKEWAKGQAPELNFRAALGKDAELALSFALKAIQPKAEVLDEALELPQELASRGHTRFCLAYDEFQEITRIDANLLGRLRSTMILQDRLGFVFLGSQEAMLHAIFTKRNEPFYRFAAEWRLPPIPPRAWSEYLGHKYLEFGLSPTAAVIDEIIHLAGGHPMDTMLLANEIIYVAREVGATNITLELVSVAFERAMISQARAFEELWHTLEPAAQQVLKRLSVGAALYQKPAPNSGTLKRAIDRLLSAGILERTGHGRYEYGESMFAEYIRRFIIS